MADQTARLEAATVKAETGSEIVYRFSNDAASDADIPTLSGEIPNLKKVILTIQNDGAEKISLAARIFPSTAAGIAGTQDQDIFLVQSYGPDEIYAVWQNLSGKAVDTGKRTPSSLLVLDSARKLKNNIVRGLSSLASATVDASGRIIEYRKLDGSVWSLANAIRDARIDSIEKRPALTSRRLSKLVSATVDKNNNVRTAVTREGQVIDPLDILSLPFQRARLATLFHQMAYGQSLSVGHLGAPALTTTSVSTKMFNGGVVRPATQTGFIAAAEAVVETGMVAGAETLSVNTGRKYLTTTWGLGSQEAAKLIPGTVNFESLISGIQAAYTASIAAGEVYSFTDLAFIHGEADEGIGTSAKDYIHYLLLLSDAVNSRVKAITSQPEPVVIWLSPSAAHTYYNRLVPTIAIATREAARKFPSLFRVVGPKYHLPYAEGLHMTNHGYRRMWLEIARAQEFEITTKTRWQPLDVIPGKSVVTGSKAIVPFYAQTYPLVLDTVSVTNPGSYGFEALDDAGALTITAVVVVNGFGAGDALQFTFNRAVTTGLYLRAAYTGTARQLAGPTSGVRCCLRDSSVYVNAYRDASNNPYLMANRCIAFNERLN